MELYEKQHFQHLLDNVATITRKNTEILDAIGGRFNMFTICGVNHYENTHSAILAEFLNPKGTHGLKSKLLNCFIETLGEYFQIQNFNCENAIVRTEYSTNEGRIDILIEDNQNKAIIIENKVYANDQWEQLKRYHKFASIKYGEKDFKIFYLSLFGNQASLQSGEGISYLPISYKETILNWLEKCVAIASRFPIVRETIVQYINHLKQLTNQDMDMKNNEEITNVLSKIENLRAAKSIYQNYSGVFKNLVEKYFSPKMVEFAKQKGLEYHFEDCDESHVKFHLTNTIWEGKCWIGFTLENYRCFYGLVNDPNIYKVSEENRKIIHTHLSTLGVNPIKQSNWWPFFAYFPNLTLDSWESDIINSDTFLNDCKGKIENLLSAMNQVQL